jgi:hypothetical protein
MWFVCPVEVLTKGEVRRWKNMVNMIKSASQPKEARLFAEAVAALERYAYGNGPDNPDYAHLTVEEAEDILARIKEAKT